jgi:HSP20 family protein
MIVRALNNHWFERPWTPLSLASEVSPFDSVRNELERLFFGQERSADNACYGAAQAASDFELKDEDSQLKLTATLPGLSETQLDLKLSADRILLHGERKVSVPEGYKLRRSERQSYSFERNIRLPIKIDPDKAEATLKDGVLTVTLPKADAAKPRSITVRAS